MIAKHIPKDSRIKDNYKALAQYIAAAKEDGEKLEHLWAVNCNGGEGMDDLDLIIKEVEATQTLNTRAGANKSYHLMVSFRAGEHPDHEAIEQMEREFAKALGFEDHQCVCGIHRNTENTHMHIAYNRIHPKTFNAHTPWNDYKKLEQTCRRLERDYGLEIDLGMSDYQEKHGRPNNQAKDYEAMTWEQSFQSYVLEHKADLLQDLATAKDWQQAHQQAAKYGLGIKPRGNGLIFTNIAESNHNEHMKVSTIDRALSKQKLEQRWGGYQSPQSNTNQPVYHYQRKPITHHKGQGRLWQKYLSQTSRTRLAKQSVTGSAFNNWKEFLYADALNDPMAMVLIYYQKKMINTLLGNNPSFFNTPPNSLRPVLNHWYQKAEWIKKDRTEDWIKTQFKDGLPQGLKQDHKGRLNIPLRDAKGELWAIHTIDAQGRSSTIGQKKSDIFHMIGKTKDNIATDSVTEHIIVTDDLARAVAIHKATQQQVAVCFDNTHKTKIAKVLSSHHKHTNIILDKPTGQEEDLRATFAKQTGDKAYQLWHEATIWAKPDIAPYLKEKVIRGFGIKQDEEDRLIIPLRNDRFRIEAVQVINQDDSKQIIGKTDQALFHIIDPERSLKDEANPLIIVKSYEDAARIYAATRSAVAMIPEGGDLEQVTASLRKMYKHHKLILTGDDERLQEIAASTRTHAHNFKAPLPDKPSEIRNQFASILNDQVYQLWQKGDYQKHASGIGLKTLKDEKDQINYMLPLYDGVGRLAGLQIMDEHANIIENHGNQEKILMHVMDFEKQRSTTDKIIISTDYKEAEAIYKATRKPVVYIPNEQNLEATINTLKQGNDKAEIAYATQNPITAPEIEDITIITPTDIQNKATSFTELKPAPYKQNKKREKDNFIPEQ